MKRILLTAAIFVAGVCTLPALASKKTDEKEIENITNNIKREMKNFSTISNDETLLKTFKTFPTYIKFTVQEKINKWYPAKKDTKAETLTEKSKILSKNNAQKMLDQFNQGISTLIDYIEKKDINEEKINTLRVNTREQIHLLEAIIQNIQNSITAPYKERLIATLLKEAYSYLGTSIDNVNRDKNIKIGAESWIQLSKLPESKEATEELKSSMYSIIEKNNTDELRTLLNRGANINIKNNHGYTPLMWAAFNNKIDIVELLLDHSTDININAKDTSGYTPLMRAIFNKNIKMVELLLKHGADINIEDDGKQTPLQYASEKNLQEIVELLKTYPKNN